MEGNKRGSIFRRSNVERINSPEALNDYMRIASPGIWLILATVAIFLAGIIIWGIYGHLDTTVSVPLVVDNGTSTLYIEEYLLDSVKEGRSLTVGEAKGTVGDIDTNPIQASSVFGTYRQHQFDLWEESWLFPAKVNISLEDGVYTASVLVESASPFTIIFQ